jgi:hypothetical protein
MSDYNKIRCSPNLSNFTKGLLNLGYSHYTALLDIIDNSIAAGASKIWIRYIKAGTKLKIVVSDNGCGMDENHLFESMRMASADPEVMRTTAKDLGKFGLGLKLAGFSLSDKFQVVSKKIDGNFVSFLWDLEIVRKENDWMLEKVEVSDWYNGNERANGTDVIIHELRTPIEDLIKVLDRLRYHLATVYNAFNNIQIFLEDKKVEPIDIFFQNHRASNHANKDTLSHDGVLIETQSFQVPHREKLDINQKRDFDGMVDIGMSDGIYLFRKKRLIAWSGWEGLGTNKKIGDLQRLAIFIEQDADRLFNIEVKKSQINILDDLLRRKIQQKITIFFTTAARPYKKRAQIGLNEIANLWTLKQESGTVKISIDRTHPIVNKVTEGEISTTEFLTLIEGSLPIDSLVYYLNIDKVDKADFGLKKWEAANVLLQHGLITEEEFLKISEKYGKRE